MDELFRKAAREKDFKEYLKLMALCFNRDSRIDEVQERISGLRDAISVEEAIEVIAKYQKTYQEVDKFLWFLHLRLPSCQHAMTEDSECYKKPALFDDYTRCEAHAKKHTQCSGICECGHHMFAHHDGCCYARPHECYCTNPEITSYCDVTAGEDRRHLSLPERVN